MPEEDNKFQKWELLRREGRGSSVTRTRWDEEEDGNGYSHKET